MEETQITQEAELRAAMTRRKLLRDASLTVGGVLAAEIVSATSRLVGASQQRKVGRHTGCLSGYQRSYLHLAYRRC